MKLFKSSILWATAVLTALLLLAGCEGSPTSENVQSKNDSIFNERIHSDSGGDTDSETPDGSSEKLAENSFSSMDSSVIYNLSADFPDVEREMPVIEVVPYSFTEEDAKRIGEILFPDSVFYEYDPNSPYSQEELTKKIEFLSEFLSSDSVLKEVYGEYLDPFSISHIKTEIQRIVDSYNAQLSNALQDQQKEICNWQYFPSEHYIESAYRPDSPQGNEEIKAILEYEGISYTFSVTNRERSDYRIHNVSTYFSESSSMFTAETNLRTYSICKASAPTGEQLLSIKNRLNDQLNSMGIGTWTVDQCYAQESGNGAYIVKATAVPVFNGEAVIRQNQLMNLKMDDLYAANFYYTDAEFDFSPSGQLISCFIFSPVEVIDVVNSDVTTLSAAELYECLETNLRFRGISDYTTDGSCSANEADVLGVVDINEIAYGLTRIKVRDKPDHYYYVPALTVRGTFDIVDKASPFNASSLNKEPETLLVINAVDGTVIDVSKGY